MERNLKEANREVENCPETIFDTFDLCIDLRNVGGALREQLVILANLYGRINQLATNSILLYEQAKNRKEEVEAIAWSKVDQSLRVTEKKITVKIIEVKYNNEITTVNAEEDRVDTYFYIYSRGKDKVKEIGAILDVGRTLLSWDKNESNKTYGSN